MSSEKPPQNYPSQLDSKPVRLKLTLIDFLLSMKERDFESINSVLERLLKWQIGRYKKNKKGGLYGA